MKKFIKKRATLLFASVFFFAVGRTSVIAGAQSESIVSPTSSLRFSCRSERSVSEGEYPPNAAVALHASRLALNASSPNPYGWDKLSSYTTYYSTKDEGRCENIAIAAALIDGLTVQPYGEFSFNGTVGRRTAEAGFQQAKIIMNGEYVQGVGGGVCQVSTTLYNAALRSGLTVTEFHPHSLLVAYVPPSRDAMVSTHSDLKFFNPYSHAVHLSARVFEGGLQITFYGKNEGDRYEIIANLLEEIEPPAPIVKTGEKEETLREAKKGAKSEAYLERYRGNTLLSRERIRRDEYRPIQGIIAKKVSLPTNSEQ